MEVVVTEALYPWAHLSSWPPKGQTLIMNNVISGSPHTILELRVLKLREVSHHDGDGESHQTCYCTDDAHSHPPHKVQLPVGLWGGGGKMDKYCTCTCILRHQQTTKCWL